MSQTIYVLYWIFIVISIGITIWSYRLFVKRYLFPNMWKECYSCQN